MGTFFKSHELRTLDSFVDALGNLGANFVVLSTRYQSWNVNFFESIRSVPIPDVSDNSEFVRTVHRMVNWLAHVSHRVILLGRPFLETEQMFLVEYHDCFFVFWIFVVSLRFIFFESRPHFSWQARFHFLHFGDCEGYVG